MGVTVAERRHEEPAAEIDPGGAGALDCAPGRRPHDDAVVDQQRIGVAATGPDRAADEQGRGHFTTAVAGCPRP